MNTLVVAILIVGAMSFSSMRREVFPEFELEIILVSVSYPGATPEEVEEGICQKVEEAERSLLSFHPSPCPYPSAAYSTRLASDCAPFAGPRGMCPLSGR